MIDGHRTDETQARGRGETAAAGPVGAGPRLEEERKASSQVQRGGAYRFCAHVLASFGPRLVSLGVKADQVTVIGILLAVATGALIGLGNLYFAVVLLTVGGLMDTLDGAVAKAAGTSSKRGAFFDSVSDRVSDMFIFGGLAWYFLAGPGHDPRLAILPMALLGVSNTISYERAKAESLGYTAKGGLMERAERLIGLGVALLLHFILVPLVIALLVLCAGTGWRRFAKVWHQASDASHPANAGGPAMAIARFGPGSFSRSRPARVESRWRAWRDAGNGSQRRRRVTPASRARSRRREEPLSIRLRRALRTELAGARATTRRATRSGGSRGERGPQASESPAQRRRRAGH
ncbi:MAG: CDP-alcohol phosphatidyltransferase family protein [Acidimicrobiales bacterium]